MAKTGSKDFDNSMSEWGGSNLDLADNQEGTGKNMPAGNRDWQPKPGGVGSTGTASSSKVR